jgi:hypothetical protein
MTTLGQMLMLVVLGLLLATTTPTTLGAVQVEVIEETLVSALPIGSLRQAEAPSSRWHGLTGLAPTRWLGSHIHLPVSVPLFTLYCVWRE